MGTKIIILLVIVLAIIAVAQLLKMYETVMAVGGKKEEQVDLRVNNFQASLMVVFVILFFGSYFLMLGLYGRGLMPDAASEHGLEIDWLYNINWVIISIAAIVTNGVLFGFAYKYRYKPNVKAYYYPHNNKLEMIWTVVPAAVLAVIIILGLLTWNDIMGKASDNAKVIEIYAKQFDFTARYSGDDNKLGYADYKLVSSNAANPNPLGIITENNLDWRIAEIDSSIEATSAQLRLVDEGKAILSKASYLKRSKEIEKLARINERIWSMKNRFSDSISSLANDDFYTKTALFLIKDQEYSFVFRSMDVIHSAYFPHFRAQMNCVPGQRTTFKFKPIYTTAEMREKTGNPMFNYILLCNKICGKSHSNMNMPLFVGTAEEFELWKNPEEGNVKPIVVAEPVLAPEVVYIPLIKESTGHGHGDDSHDEHGDHEQHDADHDDHGDHNDHGEHGH